MFPFKTQYKQGPHIWPCPRPSRSVPCRWGILTMQTGWGNIVYTVSSQASALLSVCMWSTLYLCGAAQTYCSSGFFLDSKAECFSSVMLFGKESCISYWIYMSFVLHHFTAALWVISGSPLRESKSSFSLWMVLMQLCGPARFMGIFTYEHTAAWCPAAQFGSVAINLSFQYRCLKIRTQTSGRSLEWTAETHSIQRRSGLHPVHISLLFIFGLLLENRLVNSLYRFFTLPCMYNLIPSLSEISIQCQLFKTFLLFKVFSAWFYK